MRLWIKHRKTTGQSSSVETEAEYQVIFRSYTGSFVHFYVDKASGNTRMVEVVPLMSIEEETGTINLFDFLEKGD